MRTMPWANGRKGSAVAAASRIVKKAAAVCTFSSLYPLRVPCRSSAGATPGKGNSSPGLPSGIVSGDRRHIDDVGILGVQRYDLHRLVEADQQRANNGRAAQFLQHLGRDRRRVK